MSEWNRPPAGIGVADFFEQWLPQAFAHAHAASTQGGSGPRLGLDDAPLVRATVSGPGGGAWEVRGAPEGLEVGPAGAGAPDVWVRQSVTDFRAAFDGDSDLPILIPPGWSALDLLFLDPRDVDLLRQVQGRALVELAGRRARRWSLDVAFGKSGVAAGRPRSTVRLDGATFEAIQAGRLSPVQPLLDGRMKLEGDRALAMQILLLLGSRLGRDRR
jgi:hypothetical protein